MQAAGLDTGFPNTPEMLHQLEVLTHNMQIASASQLLRLMTQ